MTQLLAFDDERALAERLAEALNWRLAFVQRHRFPDGEVRLTLPETLSPRTCLLRGLQQPAEKLGELLLTAPALREAGAEHLVLVSPYLAYMRQDIAFNPGEVVSQRVLGRQLAAWFDAVVTVDPHLHRVATMDEVVPGRRGVALSAAAPIGDWIAAHEPEAVLIGPDEEAMQWVEVAARRHGLPHGVGRKLRRGDRDVAVSLPDVDIAGRAVVLVDDVASTGRTLVVATHEALARGARSVDVAVTHALFIGDAVEQLCAAGVRHVWSTDSVPHASNVISIVPLLAEALRGA